MDLAQLKRKLDQGELAPIWVLQGEDAWSIEEASRLILKAAVGTLTDPMLVTRVDLAEPKKDARDIVGACRSIGLFTPKIAVLVRAGELLSARPAQLEILAQYASAPAQGATLIIKASKKLDGRSAFMKRVTKLGGALTYAALKPWEAERWLNERARETKTRLDRAAAKLIIELVGSDLMALANTLNQLALYAGPGATITTTEVQEALAATRAHTIFELVDAIAVRDTAGALKVAHAMLDARESPLMISAAITRHLRQLARAIPLLQAGGGPNELQRALGVHPFVAKKLAAQASRFNPRGLRVAFEELFQAELAFRTNHVAPSVSLDTLLMRLVAS